MLCGSQENAQRKQMKALLADLEHKHPTLRQTMLAAMGNVNPSHLYDRALMDANAGEAPADEDVVPLRRVRAQSS
jgi:tRNA 2-thiocytidine biosynthesis protein TtcA